MRRLGTGRDDCSKPLDERSGAAEAIFDFVAEGLELARDLAIAFCLGNSVGRIGFVVVHKATLANIPPSYHCVAEPQVDAGDSGW